MRLRDTVLSIAWVFSLAGIGYSLGCYLFTCMFG